MPRRNNCSGFTIVELLVVAPIVILVIGGFIGAIIAMTGNVLVTRSANQLVYNIQDALDRVESDVRISGGFLTTNNFLLQPYQGLASYVLATADDDTAYTASSNSPNLLDTLILNTYATTANPASSNSEVVYRTAATNSPLMMNVVYFVADNTLWRRVVAQNNYLTAGGSTPWQQASCKSINAGPICIAKDVKLVDGVTNFIIEYFSPNNNYETAIALTDIQSNHNTQIKVTIKADGSAAGRTFTESGTIRATSPNNYFDAS